MRPCKDLWRARSRIKRQLVLALDHEHLLVSLLCGQILHSKREIRVHLLRNSVKLDDSIDDTAVGHEGPLVRSDQGVFRQVESVLGSRGPLPVNLAEIVRFSTNLGCDLIHRVFRLRVEDAQQPESKLRRVLIKVDCHHARLTEPPVPQFSNSRGRD